MIIENFGIDDDLNRVGVSIYGEPDRYYYLEEFMFEFTKWCGKNYYRFTKFWRKLNSTEMGCYTTKELLEKFKEINGTNRQGQRGNPE